MMQATSCRHPTVSGVFNCLHNCIEIFQSVDLAISNKMTVIRLMQYHVPVQKKQAPLHDCTTSST
jgi:hypothetical protein